MNPAAQELRFGSFELLEALGGGMGVVYRARRDGDPRDLAVKLLRQERLLDGEARARFARELRALQQLSHPGICPLLDAGEVDGMPFLCMPFLRGRSLATCLDDARKGGAGVVTLPGGTGEGPAWARIVAVFARVADALHVAHAAGFVHRDVKPANLWIDEQGDPVLLDFGLARDSADRYRHLTRTGQIVGTPTYLAPEQLDARLGPVDARADVYGLGAVLYEALTLMPPFSGNSRAQLFANILAGLPADPRRCRPELPESLAVLIEVAIARKARDRYADAAALAADLRRLSRGEPILAHRQPLPRRIWRRVRRRPLPAAMAGALLLALGLCIGPFGRLAYAVEAAAAERVERDTRTWFGRLALARSTYRLLPPPRPQHRAALAGWLREHGQPLLQAPDEIERRAPGLRAFAEAAVADVTNRLAFAESAQARSIDAHAQGWAAAIAAVAGDARFHRFTLRPQVGLVPLGADPESSLQEFYDLASGDPALPLPQRGDDGRLTLADRHGIVFVLLPGGFYEWLRHNGLGPPTGLLAPFLLAKHELTRAQHARLDQGNDPSFLSLANEDEFGEVQTGRHPVDQLRYFEVLVVLGRWGLGLPTEGQWEYSARADGTELAPVAAGNYGPPAVDGFYGPAPVGSFPANRFGLHDMFGNLNELCALPDAPSGRSTQGGDGSGDLGDSRVRCPIRGGGYGCSQWRVDACDHTWADQRDRYTGARPVWLWEEP